MDKKLLMSAGALTIIIILALGYVFVFGQKPQVDQPHAATTQSDSTDKEEPPTISPTAAPGTYTDYKSDSIETTSDTKILFFYAPWCPQCRQLDASIKNGPLPDNVYIFKVDYDSNQALRQKYGVALQTTLVKVDDHGNLVKKFVAYNEPTLAALKKNLLE